MSSSNDKTTDANSAPERSFDKTLVQDMYNHKRLYPNALYNPPPQTGYMGQYRPEGKAAEEKAAREAIDPNPKVPPTPRPTESTVAEDGDWPWRVDPTPLKEEIMSKNDPEIGKGSRGDSPGSMVPQKGGTNKHPSFTPSTKGDDGDDKQGGS
jgi:hypothetical protein